MEEELKLHRLTVTMQEFANTQEEEEHSEAKLNRSTVTMKYLLLVPEQEEQGSEAREVDRNNEVI